MASYIMHMCISNLVKEKLNLTDNFIYGSILPDVIKNITGDRKGTHYLKEVWIDGKKKELPNMQKVISSSDIADKEIRLGYIAHLVQDLVWWTNYMSTYGNNQENGSVIYLKDGTVHAGDEYAKDIYSDYTNLGAYVIKKCGTDFLKLKEGLKKVIKNDEHIKCVEENTKDFNIDNIKNNVFMTEDNINKYICEATKETEKIILELLGE